jgi:UDP-2,3-diacylglucosamine hydrolase
MSGPRSRSSRVLFTSDVHLTPALPDVFALFCRFLEREAADAERLYILGDLFDFWVGEKQAAMPGFPEIFDRTRRLRDAGTEVFFLPGNRDFMLDGRLAADAGLTMLPDVAEIRLGDRNILLTHGDLLCTRDVRYHRMRRFVRSRPARAALGSLPLGLALRLAGGFRDASGAEISRKSAYVLDPDFGEVRAWLDRGFDALIFGHVHKGERYRVSTNGGEADVFILGAWDDVPSYVEWDGSGLTLRRYGTGA